MNLPIHRSIFQGLGVFLAAFGLIYVLYVGLPVDFTADHLTNVRGTEQASYGKLGALIANPATPAWFYPPTHDRALNRMEYLRPLQFLLMKSYFESFDHALWPFHVTAAVVFGLITVALFYFTLHWTGRWTLGWLAAALFATFPSLVFNMISTYVMDFQSIATALSLAGLYLFARATFEKKSSALFVWMVLGWVVTLWLSIKIKSTEKLLVPVCLCFLLLRFRSIQMVIGTPRILAIGGALALLFILVIPFRSFETWLTSQERAQVSQSTERVSEKDQATLAFNTKHFLARTFYVPDERVPRSLAQNYGFLSIVLGFSILYFLWSLVKRRQEASSWRRHWAWLTGIWFVASLAGFASGLDIYDSRFLYYAYLPSLLFLFTVLPERIYMLTLVLGCLTVGLNTWTLIKTAGAAGAMQDALVRSETDVFREVYGVAPDGKSLYEKHHELETRVMLVDWYELPASWLKELSDKLSREKTVYFYTRNAKSERLSQLSEEGYRPELWRRYELLAAKPLLFRGLRWMRELPGARRKEEVILIYRLQK